MALIIFKFIGIKFELPLSGRSLSRRVSKDSTFNVNNDTLAGLLDPPSKNDKESTVDPGKKTTGKSKIKTPIKDPTKAIQKLFESPGEEDNDNAIDHDEWLKDIGISPRSTLGFGRQ